MKPIVSIIMGSTSDMPVMRKAAEFLDKMEIPFEINALSAHRTPQLVEKFASNAHANGIRVIIAGAEVPLIYQAWAAFTTSLLACLAVRPSPLTVGIPFFILRMPLVFRWLPWIRCCTHGDLGGSNVITGDEACTNGGV